LHSDYENIWTFEPLFVFLLPLVEEITSPQLQPTQCGVQIAEEVIQVNDSVLLTRVQKVDVKEDMLGVSVAGGLVRVLYH